MNETMTVERGSTEAPLAPYRPPRVRFEGLRVFGALLARDLFVTVRELPSFMVQVILQPLFMLFIFGVVLRGLDLVTPALVRILLPGVASMTIFQTAVQNTALPLAVDFAATREIEDRLLAPISTTAVGVEKIVFGAVRGLIAGIIMVLIGLPMLDGYWPPPVWPVLIVISVLGALAGGALGLVIGTSVPARHIGVVFAAILLPLMFTGAAQYPFFGLHALPWFQVIVALNPMTYLSEGMRWLVLPGRDSIPLWIDFTVLLVATGVLLLAGTSGFHRKSQD
ncbi:ABC transporter permease [Sciscionella sediminilitoris]|uniref:ABC transporter permease n=1 Tax=Sciscionella sediminilitoris TaxID=1445613 RepID=UPI000B2FF019|nr:ABC transporter permease [Sciscionella sp. SE31]